MFFSLPIIFGFVVVRECPTPITPKNSLRFLNSNELNWLPIPEVDVNPTVESPR